MGDAQPLQIICLQTRLTQFHYQSYPILKQHLLKRIRRAIYPLSPANAALLDAERAQRPTLVVLPECTGSWLYLMCVPMPQIFRNYFFNYSGQSNRHNFFIAYTLFTHFPSFIKQLYGNYDRKRLWSGLIKRAWFALFAKRTRSIYLQLFGELARETNCTIVAGSTFMYENDNPTNFLNVSYVFEPEYGHVCLESGKHYPVMEEIDFIDCDHRSPSIYSIPKTNIDIGVLVCADSWMAEMYEQFIFHSNRRFLFIIVALNTSEWHVPWSGYDKTVPVPTDVKEKHLRTWSLPKAWFHYAIGRAMGKLHRQKDLLGFGVVCCQGILNVMNAIQSEGESVILIKRNNRDARILFEAKTCNNERVLTCDF